MNQSKEYFVFQDKDSGGEYRNWWKKSVVLDRLFDDTLCNSTEKIAFCLCACVLFLMLMWHQVLMKYKLEIEIHDLTIYSIVTKFKFFKLQALSYKHFLHFCRSVLLKHHLKQRNKIYDREKNVIYFFNIKLLSLTLI